MSPTMNVREDMFVTLVALDSSSSNLMKAPFLNLLNAIDNQSGYLWGGHRSKVSQCGLLNTTHRLLHQDIVKRRAKKKTRLDLHLCGLHGSANSDGIAGSGTAVTALWVGHRPTILAAKTHLSKLGSPPTSHTELRPDHLNTRSVTFH